jgi:beta-galactosidase
MVTMLKSSVFRCLLVLLMLAGCRSEVHAQASAPRSRTLIDSGWSFALGHAWDAKQDFDYATVPFFFAKAGYGDGPASPKFDDRTWRTLDLPHDWAVELPFDAKGDGNHGSKAIGRNFPQNSVGWYRKTFTVSKEDEGKRIGIDFDGVYRDAAVWLNGFYLGTEPSGYSSFHYDMTDYLNYGGSNVLVVRVDATREEGWFYEGAGIYRHVWLTETAPVHVAHDGTFVSTEVPDLIQAPLAAHPSATITAQATVQNDSLEDASFTVEETVEDATGKVIAKASAQPGQAPAGGSTELTATLSASDVHLWSLESPYLHTLVTTIRQNGKIVDRSETKFGIRTIRFDANEGFFLNGKRVELQGTDDHQDHAGVGVALPDGLQEFRIRQLKAFGSNAIRASHNPPSPAFLDACDRLGMLVLDENRMMGTNPEGMEQLRSMIVRDRNHPSVILWSVGNEEWSLEWSAFGERLTRDTEAYARRLDPTRRVTVALSGSGAGNSLSTDVLGFNYYLQHNIDKIHARFPERPVVGTEESSSEHTRGTYFDDPEHYHLVAYDFEADGKHASVEDGWKFYRARPWAAGLFYWTGFDYRGETTPFSWPAISSQFGMLDTCGFFKDNAYLLQSWWTEKPMVHLLPHWTWPGREGQPIDVRVYSNAAEIELFLNGKSLGRKAMPTDSHLEWNVPYQPGKLYAQGYDAQGKKIASDAVETTTAPAAIQLAANDTKIAADGRAISVITVRVEDTEGRTVPDSANPIQFHLTGPGKIIGVGNGDPASHEPDQYVETVSKIVVANWRTKSADSIADGPETAPAFDDSAWEKARDPRWDEKRIDPPMSVFRGYFDLPANAAGSALKLLLRSVGETQSIYLNGHALGDNLKFNPVGYEYTIDPSQLQPGRNVVAIYATRLEADKKLQAFTWNGPGPAAIQQIQPAPTWQRSVFHGLAQVIVQSSPQPGTIQLTATSPGLTESTVTFTSAAALP